jgi:hypothetical protein
LGEVLTTPSRENIHVMNYSQYEMLHMELKQSGSKLLHHSVLPGGSVSRVSISKFSKAEKGHFVRYMFRKLEGVVGTGCLRIGTGGGHFVRTVKNLRVS